MANDTLTYKQRKALEVLITSGNVSEAAQAAGVTRQTIYLWKEEKEAFQNALQQASSEIFDELALRLVNLGRQAITILQKTMEDPNAPAYVRIRAADIVIGKLLQLRGNVTLEKRIAALEMSQYEP